MAERLFSTSYRFEVYNPNTKMLKLAMANQNARIQVNVKNISYFLIGKNKTELLRILEYVAR